MTYAWRDARRPDECPSCGYPTLNARHMPWCPFADTCRCGGACREYSAAQAVAMFDRRSPIAIASSPASPGNPPAEVEVAGARSGRAVHTLPSSGKSEAAARAGHAIASALSARPSPS